MSQFSTQKSPTQAALVAETDVSATPLAQSGMGSVGADLRGEALREQRTGPQRIAGGTSPLAPDAASPTLGISGAITGLRIHHLRSKLETSLSGLPATPENILANPEARQIQLDIIRTSASTPDQAQPLVPAGRGIPGPRGAASALSPGARQMSSSDFAIDLLQADLSDALNGKAATRENILANAEARKIQVQIIDEMLRQSQTIGSSLQPAGMGGAAQPAGKSVNSSFQGGALSMRALSNYKMDIFQADLRDALEGTSVTPENILANAEARRAQRNILMEAAHLSAMSSQGAIANSSNVQGVAAGGAAPSGRGVPGGTSSNLTVASQATMSAMTLSLLEEDLRSALNGAPASRENILANPEAREAQMRILALKTQNIEAAEQALRGRSHGEPAATHNGLKSVAKNHLAQQMFDLSHAELMDALDGQGPTPETIATNERAFAAYQRMQRSTSSTMAPINTLLFRE